MKHWIQHGHKELRKADCEDSAVEKCGNENQDCKCNGRVFYGRKKAADNSEITTFKDLLSWNYEHAPSQTSVGCNNIQFKDVAVGTLKQCFCERDAKQLPFVQAEEGDDSKHFCKGPVFYVPQKNVKGTELLLEDALKDTFEVMDAKDAARGYQCKN